MWRIERARRRAVQVVAGAHRRAPFGVALTFDDGPTPAHTPALLDVLRALDVRATFFVLGQNARRHPDLVRRMKAEGHGIGSHSRSHTRLPLADRATVHAEIEGGQEDLLAVLGHTVRLFRPPYGALSVPVGLKMRRERLDSWLWSIDSEDWVPGLTVDDVVARCAGVRDRDVILMHDHVEDNPSMQDRSVTIAAVPRIVDLVRSKGLDFVAL